ncbi:trafficking protein particle complex subunit 13 [Rhodotorula paludigena]|uniref:trafficking protein particle complex subunit 13 n=1 Tax=Rhodotorula paludigena TaxID=86838 RepID=UPI003170D8AB
MASPSPTDRTPHLLAFKVLRSTRPSLVPSAPLGHYVEGPGGDSLAQLEENGMRRPGGASGFGRSGALSLPTSFGTIYLGETFNAVLSLSNDLHSSPAHASSIASQPVLKVEMHTGLTPQGPSAKIVLANVEAHEAGGMLAPGQSVETTVAHELKELGPHALVCTVTYGAEVQGEDGSTRLMSRSFRKVYKFQVNNPLSVRTKAHAPSPATATSYLSPAERSKIFLEVQVHNHCEHAMYFERMRFDPLAGLSLDDASAALFEGADALLPAGGVRQFLYILQPGKGAAPAPPGSSQGLGRLDIVWRTPHGEVGRLQSSTLGRRVPQFGVSGAAAENLAVPTATPAPGRQLLHPGRSVPVGESPALPPLPPSSGPLVPSADGIACDLFVESVTPFSSSKPPLAPFCAEEPFTVTFVIALRETAPLPAGSKRRLHLAAQHVAWHPSALSPPPLRADPAPPAARHGAQPSVTLELPGSLPSSQPSVTSLQQQQLLRPSPGASTLANSTRTSLESIAASAAPASRANAQLAPTLRGVQLPHPTPSPSASRLGSGLQLPSSSVVLLGANVRDLGEIELAAPLDDGDGEGGPVEHVRFSMRFCALEQGLVRVGGLRVLLLDSEVVEAGKGQASMAQEGDAGEGRAATTLLELGTLAEVWITTSKGK